MADLTTYEFYKTSSGVDTLVSEDDFPKWLIRATDMLNLLTNDNIDETALETYNTQIQKAICALVNAMYQVDYQTIHANDEKGNIKSMSSGGMSVSFGDNATVYTNVIGDTKKQKALYYSEIQIYLHGTGLLYQGV